MLHACEILFSGFVRARILALPNKAIVGHGVASWRRSGDGTAQQAGDGAAGGATTGDGTSTLARMGVRRRTTSDAVTVSIFNRSVE